MKAKAAIEPDSQFLRDWSQNEAGTRLINAPSPSLHLHVSPLHPALPLSLSYPTRTPLYERV